jgi:DNA gyrase subunit A
VKLITLKGNDEIASVAKVDHDEDEELDNSAIVAEAGADAVPSTDAPAAETTSTEPTDNTDAAGEEPEADDKTE